MGKLQRTVSGEIGHKAQQVNPAVTQQSFGFWSGRLCTTAHVNLRGYVTIQNRERSQSNVLARQGCARPTPLCCRCKSTTHA